VRSTVLAADYRTIVPFIFWPWLAISTFILIRRSVNRRAERRLGKNDAAQDSAAATSPYLRPTATMPAPSPAPPGGITPTTGAPVSDVGPIEPAVLAAASLPGGAGAERTIFDAPTAEPISRKPVAELLAGIQLPCDLTPLVGTERPIGAREAVAFVTRSHPSAEVGQAIGAELRRLGFELVPRHATEVVATRDDDAVLVTVYGNAAEIKRGDRMAFPGAGDDGVVVEFVTE
jgi:hypothetical protein